MVRNGLSPSYSSPRENSPLVPRREAGAFVIKINISDVRELSIVFTFFLVVGVAPSRCPYTLGIEMAAKRFINFSC